MAETAITGCPFENDAVLDGLRFTGRYANHSDADTWYPSWDSDGNLYSPWADGRMGDSISICFGDISYTGNAVLRGDDPLDLDVESIGLFPRPTMDFSGLYPGGSLCHDGHWYYCTYYLHTGTGVAYEMGPTPGFRWSTDTGETWTDTPHDAAAPLFPERGRGVGEPPIKMGAPRFVDLGRNMEHSPDGLAYLIGFGTSRSDGTSNYAAADEIFLARVQPSPSTINNLESYEFFAGTDAQGEAVWSRSFDDLSPIVDWPGRTGMATMTFNAGLGKYMLFASAAPWHGMGGPYDLWLAVSDSMWGPWKLVSYMERFGTQGYFVNAPTKFLSDDGHRGWLVSSASWYPHLSVDRRIVSDPPGTRYALCLHEFEIGSRA